MRRRSKPLVIELLKKQFGERVSTRETDLWAHGHDASWHKNCPPDGVIYPESTEQVSQIVQVCAAHQMPVIPFGAGTALEGHVQAIYGGVCIDLSRMNQIISISETDMMCCVEAGVTYPRLRDALLETALIYAGGPQIPATIGGMASCGGSGVSAIRYGTMKENVISLEVVLADGRVIETGTPTRKTSAGYDLTHLFVGSEGTLGVVTKVLVRLHARPEQEMVMQVSFKSFNTAVNTVISALKEGIQFSKIEFIDDQMVDKVNQYSGLNLPVSPMIWAEFAGSDQHVNEQRERFKLILQAVPDHRLTWSQSVEEIRVFWQARADAYHALSGGDTRLSHWASDVCVPISNLATCLIQTKQEMKALNNKVHAGIMGHVGDGNFHVSVAFDARNEEHVMLIKAFNVRLMDLTNQLNGTCSGEHGIGLGKRDFLEHQHASSLPVMLAIKNALDPFNIMNPGKILHAERVQACHSPHFLRKAG